jgi:hypothetical protein
VREWGPECSDRVLDQSETRGKYHIDFIPPSPGPGGGGGLKRKKEDEEDTGTLTTKRREVALVQGEGN